MEIFKEIDLSNKIEYEIMKHPIIKENNTKLKLPKRGHLFIGIKNMPNINKVVFIFDNIQICGKLNETNNYWQPFEDPFPIYLIEYEDVIINIFYNNNFDYPVIGLYIYNNRSDVYKLSCKLIYNFGIIKMISGMIMIT